MKSLCEHNLIHMKSHFSCFALNSEKSVKNRKIYPHKALWLYTGLSFTERDWPTCVWVRPRDNRRSLNALANSLISSKSMPSTTLQFAWEVDSSEKWEMNWFFQKISIQPNSIWAKKVLRTLYVMTHSFDVKW